MFHIILVTNRYLIGLKAHLIGDNHVWYRKPSRLARASVAIDLRGELSTATLLNGKNSQLHVLCEGCVVYKRTAILSKGQLIPNTKLCTFQL